MADDHEPLAPFTLRAFSPAMGTAIITSDQFHLVVEVAPVPDSKALLTRLLSHLNRPA